MINFDDGLAARKWRHFGCGPFQGGTSTAQGNVGSYLEFHKPSVDENFNKLLLGGSAHFCVGFGRVAIIPLSGQLVWSGSRRPGVPAACLG